MTTTPASPTTPAPPSGRALRVGTDIGGTFTDFVVLDPETGAITLEKRLTTPDDPARAVVDGVDALASARPGLLERTEILAHGTTLVINALIERTGGTTALLTTEGFEDVLEIRREVRYDAYDLELAFPRPLVPRRLRFGVRERLHASGRELVPVDADQVREIVAGFAAAGVESVAVCLLHSYADGEHERQVARIVRECRPDLWVSLSSEVLPEVREYERTSTTVANAYVRPLLSGYLRRLESALDQRGFAGGFHVMQSTGGVVPLEVARTFPVRVVESGPAGGVLAAARLGAAAGVGDLLAFDMGGTTAKVAAVVDGQAAITHDYEVARTAHFRPGSGIPVCTPVLDLLEIGTGGGSIAHVDSLGLIKVGPRSAGSTPGPAAYGRGGDRPTVTDADLVLGCLDPDRFLGGEMPLRADLAAAAVAALGAPLGLDAVATAHAIREAAEESMVAAARVHLAELGLEPSRLPVVAYGGAGPVHAVGLARRLGSPRVLVPPAAGVMSALGLILAPATFETSQTYKVKTDRLDLALMDELFRQMEKTAAQLLPNADGRVEHTRWADMRYVGQGFEVSVGLPGGDDWAALSAAEVTAQFKAAYERRYRRSYDDVAVETMNLRLRATLTEDGDGVRLPTPPSTGRAAADAVTGHRDVHLPDGTARCPVYDRALLEPGMTVAGPALIQERETTTVLDRGSAATIGALGIISVEIEGVSGQ
ncbi:hydantoinase/oxoprolinase family protein [Actinomadura chibensis]|uniref:Hydantoinase/oxoprolinase family protein n=1 Tax=Actinomadura chibensis TaxID=392828 RepID=A0A5D0NDZ9_9ACTN|nr:hydantoinase/oxoprolinase family protein [Actinomadura chibensis]TYB42451.1 hydantoinase/oxoprolinase family protein [Actinomadura chibensis]